MRVLNVLRFVLIAGILSSVIGEKLSSFRDTRVPSHLRLLGFLNTTALDVENFDQQMCTKNGGPSAHDDHKKSWDHAQLCIYSIIMREGSAGMSGIDNKNMSRLERDNLGYEHYCRQISSFENCFKNVTDTMKTCLDPEKHENVNILYNTIDSLMQFMCENKAARLKAFMNFTVDSGRQCLRSKEQAIQECANHTIFNYIRSTVTNGAAIGRLGAIHLLEPDLTKCTIFENFQTCTVGLLKECNSSMGAADLADSIFNLVKKATKCNPFLKSQASSITVVNLLLISTAAITMFFTNKRF